MNAEEIKDEILNRTNKIGIDDEQAATDLFSRIRMYRSTRRVEKSWTRIKLTRNEIYLILAIAVMLSGTIFMLMAILEQAVRFL
jgi:hypothetical protein